MRFRYALILPIILLLGLAAAPQPRQGGIHSGTGGGASAMCAAVVQSGLKACYDSGSGLTCTGGCTSGNAVTQWNDQSSNMNNLTCSSCGLYESAQINSNPAVRFDGSANFYSFGTSINLQTADTIFVVFKSSAGSAAHSSTFVSGTAAGSISYENGLVNGGAGNGNAQSLYITSFQETGTALADTSWHQANMSYNATTITFRINETLDKTASLSTAVTANETTVGYYAEYGSDFFQGDIAAIIIYNSALSAPNVATNEAVLNAKYGI